MEFFKFGFDHVERAIGLSLEFLKNERFLENLHIFTFLKVFGENLKLGKIVFEPLFNRRDGQLILIRIVDDDLESWRIVGDKSVNKLSEICLRIDRHEVLSGRTHITEQFLELVDKSVHIWVELDLVVVVEVYQRLDRILLSIVVHLFEDEIGRLLIDTNLRFHNSVVNQTDEGAKRFVVLAGEAQNLIFQVLFLFLSSD